MRRSENVRSLAPPPVLKTIGTVEVAALAATAAVMPVAQRPNSSWTCSVKPRERGKTQLMSAAPVTYVILKSSP